MKDDALEIQVERRIYLMRGEKVMLDFDLAEPYGVETKALNKAMKRTKERFPPDFVFQLTAEEVRKPRRARWSALSAPRFHRARRSHAL